MGVLDYTHLGHPHISDHLVLPAFEASIWRLSRKDQKNRLWWHGAKHRIHTPLTDTLVRRWCYLCLGLFIFYCLHYHRRHAGNSVCRLRMEVRRSPNHATPALSRPSRLGALFANLPHRARIFWELLLSPDLLPISPTVLTFSIWRLDSTSGHHHLSYIDCVRPVHEQSR